MNSTSTLGNSNRNAGISIPKHFVAILDVGHGSCAVVVDTGGVVVVDTGPGSSLLEFLTEQKIDTIQVVLISHADEDHIGGLVQLLASHEFRVDKVRLNTDSLKESAIWDDLLYELARADNAEDLDFEPSLVRSRTGAFDQGEVHIEILGPSPYLAGKGPGSTDRAGRRVTTNSISATVRLSSEGQPLAVLMGDIDTIGLNDLSDAGVDTTAPLLTFPHHGGRSDSADMAVFAGEVCNLVSPSIVVFSIGRGKHGTPRPEVVDAVRKHLSGAWVICTQLSEHCAATVPHDTPSHLADVFSCGRERGYCCAGTVVITWENGLLMVLPAQDLHREFVSEAAPKALCVRASASVST